MHKHKPASLWGRVNLWPVFFALSLLLGADPAWAGLKETIKSNRNLPELLQGELTKLYASQQMADKGLEELEALVKAGELPGDRVFPFYLLGRLAAGEGVPAATQGAKWLGDLQEDALEQLIDHLNNDDLTLSDREMAVFALGRVAASTATAEVDFNETALKALVKTSQGKEGLLARAAVSQLGGAVIRPGQDADDLNQDAGKALAKEIEEDDPERRWYAIFAAVGLLKAAPVLNKGVEEVWETLNDELDEFASPLQQAELRRAMGELLRAKQDKPFAKLAAATKKELEGMTAKETAMEGDMTKVLDRLADADDPEDLDEALLRGLALSTRSAKDMNRLLFWLQSACLDPKLSGAKLRFYYFAFALGAFSNRPLLPEPSGAGGRQPQGLDRPGSLDQFAFQHR